MFSQVIFVPKDWGWERIIWNDEKYCGKILFIKKGSCISLQYHKLKDETFIYYPVPLRPNLLGWKNS